METRFRDTERRMMTALEMVNIRVSYQVDVRSRESSEFYSRHHHAQKDRAAVRAKTDKMAPKRATGSTPITPALTATTTTVTEAQLQALIDQGVAAAMAKAESSRVRNGYASNGSGPRPAQAWNAHVKTTTPEAAHAMPWATLKKMMTDKYCPRGCSQKRQTRLIHGNVKASKPKTMQEAIEFTTELMDEKTHAYAERQAERKRKYDDLSKNNQNQQQQNKR
ncbi:hypothetical protein Tco_1530711 [Tanacetum coccineum]